ncbi:MAG: hypothetical protein A4E66_02205 [Syntrophus sp. PtaB.Bin001]|jgi:nitrogen regulatory protein PII|nr:MAG: hypothetical protein A4E66_02205 [Syntrophus sp. PtaB.Bin001]
MKMMMIVFAETVDQEVMEVLAGAGIKKYIKMERVIGRSPDEENLAQEGSLYWPEKYTLMMLAVKDEEVSTVTDMFRKLKKEHPVKGGYHVFVVPMEQLL